MFQDVSSDFLCLGIFWDGDAMFRGGSLCGYQEDSRLLRVAESDAWVRECDVAGNQDDPIYIYIYIYWFPHVST